MGGPGRISARDVLWNDDLMGSPSHDNACILHVQSQNSSYIRLVLLSLCHSGRFGWDETLLHICARQRLEETALMLLQPHFVEGKAFFLLKKAPYDNKTPLEIARKNGMKRMAGLAEITMVRRLVEERLLVFTIYSHYRVTSHLQLR